MASPFASVGVVGAGAWGAALAQAAAQAGRKVVLWARDPATVVAIRATGIPPRLPGIVIDKGIVPTSDLRALAGMDLLILAVPTQSQRDMLGLLSGVISPKTPVISAAKGIERGSALFVTQVIAEALPQAIPAVLSGPSFADDVSRGLPTALSLAAADGGISRQLAEALSSPAFRIYHGTDVRGVEIGGAAKNVLAIAAGVSIGLGFGDSARAAIVARGFAELHRFGLAHGAQAITMMGLSGLGDLVLTCGSAHSRNFALGLALGQGQSIAQATGGKLAEGAMTAQVLARMARERGLEMPIVDAVDAILSETVSVREAVAGLLARPLRGES